MTAVNYVFPSLTISMDTPPEQISQYRVFAGSASEDSVSIGTDLASITSLTTQNGNLQWGQDDGSTILVTSEIDYILGGAGQPYYMNLNTERSAAVGFVMNDQARAIISYEWLDAFNAGTVTLSYENRVGSEALDTVIEGAGGTVILADYNLEERLDEIITIGTNDGGILIDFNVSATA